MCPIVTKEVVVRDCSPWFIEEILRAKKDKKGRKDCGEDISLLNLGENTRRRGTLRKH